MITFDENYLINKNSEGLNKVIPQRKFEIVNKEEELKEEVNMRNS